MTTYAYAGNFGYAGGGKGGATVDMWLASRFSGFPAENQAPPSGSPDAGPVTTGTNYGGPGGFYISGIATIADYYIRVQYGGNTYWAACSANDLIGAPVASGVTDVTGDGTSISVANGTTIPIISLDALTGDVTTTAGHVATTLVGTSNVESIIAANSTVAGALQKTGGTMSGALFLAGVSTAPTATPGTNTTQVASTAFVNAAVTTGLTKVPLYGVGTALSGSPPSAGAPAFYIQAGQNAFTFTGGLSSAYSFPSAFPNGVLIITATPQDVGVPIDFTINLTGFTASAFSLGATNSGSAYSGTVAASWIAIGF
jgi:hypothetical protein